MSRCQHENRSGAKFCEECATPLARTCSNCGSQLSATAKFCPECADRFDPDAGVAHYRQALALAEPRGMGPLIAHCHLGLGKLYRRIGEREQAHEHLTTATTMYREMDMRFWLEQAEAELRERA